MFTLSRVSALTPSRQPSGPTQGLVMTKPRLRSVVRGERRVSNARRRRREADCSPSESRPRASRARVKMCTPPSPGAIATAHAAAAAQSTAGTASLLPSHWTQGSSELGVPASEASWWRCAPPARTPVLCGCIASVKVLRCVDVWKRGRPASKVSGAASLSRSPTGRARIRTHGRNVPRAAAGRALPRGWT